MRMNGDYSGFRADRFLAGVQVTNINFTLAVCWFSFPRQDKRLMSKLETSTAASSI